MPTTEVRFYADERNKAPVLEWLRDLRTQNVRAYTKCVAAVQELTVRGHELRRPLADYLGDGVYELRIRVGRQNYRILYFFHGRNVAILGHALTKEGAIPQSDMRRTRARKLLFERDPEKHSYEETLDG